MTMKTIYTCNFCGHEQDSEAAPRKMYQLTLSARQVGGQYDCTLNLKSQTAHVCDKCAGDKLLFKAAGTAAGGLTMTIEDLVRDLAADEYARQARRG